MNDEAIQKIRQAGRLLLEACDLAQDEATLDQLDRLCSDWQHAITGSLEEVGDVLINAGLR